MEWRCAYMAAGKAAARSRNTSPGVCTGEPAVRSTPLRQRGKSQHGSDNRKRNQALHAAILRRFELSGATKQDANMQVIDVPDK